MTSKTQISDQRYGIIGGYPAGQSVILVGDYWSMTQGGPNSPRVNGKLVLRENAFSKNITSYRQGYINSTFSGQVPSISGNFLDETRQFLADPWTSNDELALVNKAYSQWKFADFHGGNALGESRQTLMMIGDTARTMAKFLSHVRDGNLIAAARTLGVESQWSKKYKKHEFNYRKFFGSMSNAVLSYQFGWRPLYSDVYHGAQAVASALNKPVKLTVRASRTAVIADVWKPSPTSWWTYNRLSNTKKVMILRGVEAPGWNTILGLDDPLSVAWEKTPFSFIGDWWLPVSSYLTARSFARTVRFNTLITSTKTTQLARVASVKPTDPVNFKIAVVTPGFYKQMAFTRTVSNSLDLPAPSLKPLTKDYSVAHVIDSIALIGQALLRRPGLSYWDNPLD